MKTERAIELLHRLQDEQFDGIHGDERREALEMAVRALESNLVKGSDGLVNDLVKDCISRQQAIDAVAKAKVGAFPHDAGINNSIKAIKALPSAQPELLEHEAYIRGFEQGRTQGMIDAQERKK